jgi:fatty-acyl-CoA synthase
MKDHLRDEQCRRIHEALLPNIADFIALHAIHRPKDAAIIEHDTGETVTWKQFNISVSALAAKLLSIGLAKGDIIATSLPLLKEHVYLIYACYRSGIIIAPLDLRLKADEIRYCLEKLKPKAYFFLGKTPAADFRPIIREVMPTCPYVRHWVQCQKEADLIMEGAVSLAEFTRDMKKVFFLSLFNGQVRKAHRLVEKRDAALILFTTGSTGLPKPALLCHENIMAQNIGLCVGFDLENTDRMLINLPPSHVGCTTEQLGTILFRGGVAVLLHTFDAKLSLEAIEKRRVTLIGQIPALFTMEWRLADYQKFDLSSLRFAIYRGQTVPREFLLKMKAMAPRIGTGLGLTETAGFCTYTNVDADVDELARGIGHDSPLCTLTIREAMNPDGDAGAEKPKGEVGEICFSGPQVFLGYLNDPENTARTISKEGICYTGDLGSYDRKGLHLTGRTKPVIKPEGYQVFTEDRE